MPFVSKKKKPIVSIWQICGYYKGLAGLQLHKNLLEENC